ncbi:helix-turn-helix domain-containing protein [Chromobacterium subtsugae]|uniref:helix-turn-helix domain-containing protein n=1 Tax=Chromobacterium subtsugae TaxID=251747 RepID=UPI001C0FDF2F|nr:helix-turn-helix transcriptional regulator [Chromobacterium subtsugae]
MEQIGERIREARESRGWNQEQLARKVGIGRSTLSNIENGGQDTTTEVFFSLAKALKLNPIWVYYGTGPREPAVSEDQTYISAESLEDLAERMLGRGPDEIAQLFTLIIKKQAERR